MVFAAILESQLCLCFIKDHESQIPAYFSFESEMADKIAERKRIAAERGYTPKIWQKTSFKRSFKPYTPGSERQLKPRAELFCRYEKKFRKSSTNFVDSWVQSEKNVDPSRLFYHGAKLPELSLIKNFLNFYVSTSTGRIRQKSTIETVQNYCNCVTGYLRREVGCEYSQADQKDLSNVGTLLCNRLRHLLKFCSTS